MLAWIQRLIVVSIVMFVGGWIAWCLHVGSPLWAFAAPLVIPLGYASVLALEFARMRATYASDDPLRPSVREALRAWRAECSIGPRVFGWWQPFRSHAIPDRLDGAPRRGIVFVHGFVCNRGVWTPWLRRLQRSDDRDFVAVDLEPVFGSIERYAATIGEAVERLRRSTGLAPIVVAHSMGGLAVRWWLASTARADAVHRVVTIATPHGGTRLSRRAGSRNAGQMAEGSPWLAKLAALENEGPNVSSLRSRFVCFWGHCDNIVFPTRLAMLDGADNRHLRATPHVRMVYHPDVHAAVMALADAPAPPAPA